jgi:hypothetical protein
VVEQETGMAAVMAADFWPLTLTLMIGMIASPGR